MKDQEFEKELSKMEIGHKDLISREEEETAWKEILLEIDSGQKYITRRWWFAAASLLMILFIGWLVFPLTQSTFRTDHQQQLDIDLPDRSKVTLHHNSALTLQKDYNELDRSVYLKGMAFFNVKADQVKPFLINLDDRQVKVVGTSFLVSHREENTIVTVRTGTVEITHPAGQDVLVQGQKIRIKSGGEVLPQEWDINDFAWYSGSLVFEDESMQDVAEILSGLSSKPVVVSEAVGDCRLSLKVEYERIEEVFDIVAETLGIEWSEQSKRIYFDGEGC